MSSMELDTQTFNQVQTPDVECYGVSTNLKRLWSGGGVNFKVLITSDFTVVQGAADHKAIIRFLTEPEREDSILPDELLEERKTMILSLRGFLAFSVLQHCLEKRHSVEHGIRRSHGKRLAVPYRASNTPSERSEFKHPDCAIVPWLPLIVGFEFDGLKQDFSVGKEVMMRSCFGD